MEQSIYEQNIIVCVSSSSKITIVKNIKKFKKNFNWLFHFYSEFSICRLSCFEKTLSISINLNKKHGSVKKNNNKNQKVRHCILNNFNFLCEKLLELKFIIQINVIETSECK
jgi:hypothetical protein